MTDKRADEFDGGGHDILLTGFEPSEWFDPDKRSLVPIGECPAAEVSEEGLKLHLEPASQYIFR